MTSFKQSSLSAALRKGPHFKQQVGTVEVLGKPKKVVLKPHVFQKLKETWTTRDSEFNDFMNKFNKFNAQAKKANARAKRKRKGKLKKQPAPEDVAFSDFTFGGITDRQRSMSQVLPNAETVDRVRLDGVEFRTEASTVKIRTDNSWIEMLYQENGETCSAFGRIQRIYNHTLAPELDAEVFLDCKWYELAEDATPLPSGLPQVRYNPYWERSSMVPIRVCRPVSFVC